MDIKLVALDVDGVLTDGRLWIGTDGIEYKSFHVKDGLGISLAHMSGIKVAWISGRTSKAVRSRAKELNVEYLFEGVKDKVEVLTELVSYLGITLSNVFYMGDDINDLPAIRIVGLSAAPSDAVDIVKEEVNFVCNCAGGNGAVREAIELILEKQNRKKIAVERYINQSEGLGQ